YEAEALPERRPPRHQGVVPGAGDGFPRDLLRSPDLPAGADERLRGRLGDAQPGMALRGPGQLPRGFHQRSDGRCDHPHRGGRGDRHSDRHGPGAGRRDRAAHHGALVGDRAGRHGLRLGASTGGQRLGVEVPVRRGRPDQRPGAADPAALGTDPLPLRRHLGADLGLAGDHVGGDPVQRARVPCSAAGHQPGDLRGRGARRCGQMAGDPAHHDPGRSADGAGAAGAHHRLRLPQLRFHLRDDLRRARHRDQHADVPGLPAGLQPLRLRPGRLHLGDRAAAGDRAGRPVQPQHNDGGAMSQKASLGEILIKVLLTLLYGVPLLWIVLTSLKPSSLVFDRGSMFVFTPTLDAYTNALNSELFTALRQSILIAAGTTAVVLLIAVPAAYGLARTRGALVAVLLGALIVLQMLPQTATVIPLFQLFGSWRLLDSLGGVILADAALLTPFAIILLRPFFRTVPIELEEAAAIDGTARLGTFLRIALPVARNGVATTGTIVFLLAWGEFLYAVNFFLSPGTYPLSALLAQQVSAFGIDWPGLMALAVLTAVPILIVYSLSYRLLRDGLPVGAVKGDRP